MFLHSHFWSNSWQVQLAEKNQFCQRPTKLEHVTAARIMLPTYFSNLWSLIGLTFYWLLALSPEDTLLNDISDFL